MQAVTRAWVLLSLCLVLAAAQLPSPPSSGPYLIPPGIYNLTSDIYIDVNATNVIAGNCTAPGVCVTIDLQGFSFSLSSANQTATLQVSGILFTGGILGQSAALNLTARIGSVSLVNVAHENAAQALLAGIPPNTLSLSSAQFINNTAYKMVDLYCSSATSATFWSMGVISITSVTAENNFGPGHPSLKRDGNTPRNASYVSLFSFMVDSIDSVSITHSNFINNLNVLVSGDSPTSIYPNGITALNIVDCLFEGHEDPLYPIILQTTTSTTTGSWNVTSSRIVANVATFMQVISTSSVSSPYSDYLVGVGFVNNVFMNNPGLTFWGALQSGGYFSSNVYTGGSGSVMLYSCIICPGYSPAIQHNNETYDFGLSDVTKPLLQYNGFQSVLVHGTVFKNIEASNITSTPSVLFFTGVTSVTVVNSAFQNVSFTTNNQTFAGRIMMNYNTANGFVSNLALHNVSFDSYDPQDNMTADVAQFVQLSATGTLVLSGYTSPSNTQLLNLSRIAATGNVNITSPQLVLQEKLYNPIQDYSLALVSVSSRLFVKSPLLVQGRIDLTLRGAVNFTLTPALNGTILLKGTSNFVPSVDASAAIFTVDLGSGLSVPLGSQYDLVSNGINIAPTAAPLALKDGSSNAYFTGVLALTNQTSDQTYTYGVISMVATPLCNVSCIKGACQYREVCVCMVGWSGEACTCLEQGRPPGAQCTSSLTSFQWITSSPQAIAPTATLAIPDQLTYFVNNDLSVAGTLTLTATSSVVVYGSLSINGTVILASTAANYAGSCDIYIPNMILASSLTLTTPASVQVTLSTATVSVCPASKREAAVSASNDYNVLIAANTTTAMSGTLVVNSPSLLVNNGRQQQLHLITTDTGNLTDVTITGGLTVTANVAPALCSYENTSPQLLSLFISPCNGEVITVQWWWYGAPVIGIAFFLFVIVALSIMVPSWRLAVYPWTARAAKE